MTNIEKLITAFWKSENGHYQLADGKTFKPVFVSPISNINSEVAKIHNKGVSVFFACAEFLTPSNRKAENAAGASGFWLDIDCGPEKAETGKGYIDQETAFKALNVFCKKCGLPKPTHFVSSGGGLHAYWSLTEFVIKTDWLVSAGKLKALTRQLKLLADDSRTADIASLLRVPDTLNYKYDPPRPVELLHAGNPLPTSEFLSKIEAAYQANCTPTSSNTNISPPNFSDRMSEINVNIDQIKSALASIDPDCDRKEWIEILCALSWLNWSCSEELAEKWSKGEVR